MTTEKLKVIQFEGSSSEVNNVEALYDKIMDAIEDHCEIRPTLLAVTLGVLDLVKHDLMEGSVDDT